MTTKHTPGPWKACGTAVHSSSGREIIFGAHNTRSAEKDEQRANANLIAAAPELLEALEHALAALNDAQGLHPFWVYSDAREAARTAISKAKME